MPRPRHPRPLKDEETKLFVSMMADATPLKKRPEHPAVLSQPRKQLLPIRALTHPPIEDRPAPMIRARERAATSAMDGKNAERLIRGRLEIEARLDLHGHRQDTAQRELTDFIRRNHSYGKRCVLVITGKGRSQKNRTAEDLSVSGGNTARPSGGSRAPRYAIPERGGVLFDLVPEWLAGRELAPYVVAFSPSQPRHGGSGALYVYLRRDRS
jgi:DNA-nicking Smr family endonuclease